MAIYTTWEEAYVALATAINNMVEYKPYAYDYVKEALSVIIDIGETTENSYLIETNLLPILHDLYLWVYMTWNHDLEIRVAIEKINDFTIKYYGDLTIFINRLSWPDGCVPCYWAEYSESSGYDTSEWPICSCS
jgi:hypothetical protein